MPIEVVYEPRSGWGKFPIKCWTKDIEHEAEEQLRNTATLPFIHKHIAVMPDVHWGMGSTVGSVVPTIRAIVPACVGVDIGCGMTAQKLPIKAEQLPDNLGPLRAAIEQAIPHGRTNHGGPGDRGAWGEAPQQVLDSWAVLGKDGRFELLTDTHPKLLDKRTNTFNHLGTLGTGNHFVEVCLDLDKNVWVMLHSGSRGIGNRIGTYFIEKAKEEMERWHIVLADKNLAYLPQGTELFNDYISAMSWAQDFAYHNRELMLAAAVGTVLTHLGLQDKKFAVEKAISCHHNYVAWEHHYRKDVLVTRKGAIRARAGDLGIVPGSMGTRSYIVRGRGNPESFTSCSHGAGRRMSRGEATRSFTSEDLLAQTDGVECRKDLGVIDEIPGAYKEIEKVIAQQSDLIDVVTELKQVICVKG